MPRKSKKAMNQQLAGIVPQVSLTMGKGGMKPGAMPMSMKKKSSSKKMKMKGKY